jgi:hypothetical protein
MMKVIVVFKSLLAKWERPTWPPSIQMGVTAGIFLASILLKEMRYLVYIRYLWVLQTRNGHYYVLLPCELTKNLIKTENGVTTSVRNTK